MRLPRLVIDRHGRENVTLVMARLPNEDPDVWRLCDAVEADLGVPITYIGSGKSPWDVFYEHRFLGNTRVDLCSRLLKREVIRDWLKAHCDPADTVIHVGIMAHELERMVTVRKNYTRMGWVVDAPLVREPLVTREALMQECQRRYGFVPRLYLLGWDHNNCSGACVKAGQREWAKLLRHLPAVYAWWEDEERTFRAWIGKDVAILRDRTGGTVRPLTLEAFRGRCEDAHGAMIWDDLLCALDASPACMSCAAI